MLKTYILHNILHIQETETKKDEKLNLKWNLTNTAGNKKMYQYIHNSKSYNQ